jgi:methyl-accepting chemotaxis protein
MVEETSAAARNLVSEVTSLSEQSSRFNTGGGAARPAPRAAAKPVKSYASPVKPLPAAAIPALVRSPVTAGDGGDDWNAF